MKMFICVNLTHIMWVNSLKLFMVRQAPRAWFSLFSSYLLTLGFQARATDFFLFILHQDNAIIVILVYVDDIILTGSDASFFNHLIQQLSTRFVMTETGLFLSQAKYATEILTKAGMNDCKPSNSPTSTKKPIDLSDPFFEDVALFITLVGSLQYLTLTHPKIALVVNSVYQHMHRPKISHFEAVKMLLRYVKDSITHGLHLSRGSMLLTAFTDANWARDPNDRRSTIGFVVFSGSNPISWSAKKQPTVARSSIEAKYRAMAQTATDIVWIQQLFSELKLSISPPRVLWCDNRSAMALASNPVFHARTKHIEMIIISFVSKFWLSS